MASLTIRNLEEALKGRLRVRAASRGRSMEEEARHIIRDALSEALPPTADIGDRIRKRFAALGDVQLSIAPREPVRDPLLGETSAVGVQRRSRPSTRSPAPSARERRR